MANINSTTRSALASLNEVRFNTNSGSYNGPRLGDLIEQAIESDPLSVWDGTADPSVAGVEGSSIGDLYLRNAPGVDGGQLWIRFGDDATDWSLVNTVATMSLADGHLFVGSAGGVAADVALSGEASILNTGAITLDNDSVIQKLLTGYTAGPGVIAATDSILEAIQKLDGNKLDLSTGDDLSGTGQANFIDIVDPLSSAFIQVAMNQTGQARVLSESRLDLISHSDFAAELIDDPFTRAWLILDKTTANFELASLDHPNAPYTKISGNPGIVGFDVDLAFDGFGAEFYISHDDTAQLTGKDIRAYWKLRTNTDITGFIGFDDEGHLVGVTAIASPLTYNLDGATFNSWQFQSLVDDSVLAIAYELDTLNELTVAGAKLMSLKTAGTEKFSVDLDGNVTANNLLVKNAVSGSFTTVDGKTITVVDGQITAIV